MTASTPGPAEQAVAGQQVSRIVDDLARDHEDRFPRDEVEEVSADSDATLARTARVTTFLPVPAGRFACERLDARALAEGKRARRAPAVLFVCVHDAGRSALAVALARHRAADRIDADSAGTTPDDGPSAATVATLAELGIDASAHQPSAVTADRVAAADVVVAMKPGLELPHVDGVRYQTWSLPDPAGWDAEGIRPLRDEVDRRVKVLIAELADTRSAPEAP